MALDRWVEPQARERTRTQAQANAARLRLEPIFADWISGEQRGFVGGRSMLANLVFTKIAAASGG